MSLPIFNQPYAIEFHPADFWRFKPTPYVFMISSFNYLTTCMAYYPEFTRIYFSQIYSQIMFKVMENSLQIQFSIVHRIIIHGSDNLALFDDGYLSPFKNSSTKRFVGGYLRCCFYDQPSNLTWSFIEAIFRTSLSMKRVHCKGLY